MRNWAIQTRNVWELTVTGLDTFLDGGILALAIQDVSLPSETTDSIVVPYLNVDIKFAGKTTIGDFSATFRDYCDQNTYDAILAWRRTVVNHGLNRAGLPADYKKDAVLKLFSPDLDTGPTYIRSWDIKGLWPSSHDPGGVSMSDTDQLTISVNLVADKAIPNEGFSS